MITWRPYRIEDECALKGRHQAQCAAMGAQFALPDLADPRYLMAEVAERGREVVGAVVAHATVEIMFVGGDPGVARAAVRRQDYLRRRLLDLGCDEVHAFVPVALLRPMEPILRRMGFRRSNQDYIPFYQAL